MADKKLADLVCCENPARVFEGEDVGGGIVGKQVKRSSSKRTKTAYSKKKRFGWFGC
jgi:hypothetical protein